MTKAPTPTEMSKGQSDNTNNATKKLYTMITDILVIIPISRLWYSFIELEGWFEIIHTFR